MGRTPGDEQTRRAKIHATDPPDCHHADDLRAGRAWHVLRLSLGRARLPGQYVSQRHHRGRVPGRRPGLLLAGGAALFLDLVDRGNRLGQHRAPGPPAAPSGPAGRHLARARHKAATDLGLVAFDPRFRRRADGGKPRHHALYHQPADFPGSSGHVLRAGHHRSGGGGDHPVPATLGGGKRDGGVRAPHGRAGGTAWRHGQLMVRL